MDKDKTRISEIVADRATTEYPPGRITDGRLFLGDHTADPVDWLPAHDVRGPFLAPPQVLVIHYGAGTKAGDLSILTRDDDIYVSAHIYVAESGRVVQMARLDEVALHAGDATRELVAAATGVDLAYHGRTFNYTSIGIETENRGWLDSWDATHAWREAAPRTPRIPLADCIGPMPHPLRGGRPYYWPKYSEALLLSLIRVSRILVREIPSIRYILGHDEISPRKFDPGPALDMAEFRAFVKGA
jgi:N-acetylmuramoyl-L-alanine amidase